MAKYNIGDIVKVREDLNCIDLYYMENSDTCYLAVVSMCDFRGKCVTIADIVENGSYKIKEMGCYWTDEMFVDFIKSAEISNDRQNECDFEEIKTDISDLINFYKKNKVIICH